MATRTVNEAISLFAKNIIPTQRERDAAAQHRESVEAAINAALDVRRFRQVGSFRHGTAVRSHADVDLLVSIGNAQPGSSDTALTWIRDALQRRFPYTTIRVSRPAVVAEFAGGDETWEVIPGFLTGRGGADVYVYDIPGAASGWIDTAPEEHLDYVNECNQISGMKGAAKELSRFLKAWKYYNNVPISSFYLEMRAAQYIKTQTQYVRLFDLKGVLVSLWNHQLAGMNDPKGASGRFNACSSEARKNEALSKLNTAQTRATKALDAVLEDKPGDAFYYLNLLFGAQFPSQYY